MNREPSRLLEHVATTIRSERRNLHMSMEQLAEKSNVSLQTIKDIEHAKRTCQIDTLVSIASVLHLSTDEILGLSALEIKDADFDSVYKTLNNNQKYILLEIAKVLALNSR